MSMTRYRLEWRSPATVDEAPSLAMSSEHRCSGALVRAARVLAADGSAHDGAFRVSELRPDGSSLATVATDMSALEEWSGCARGLPVSAATAWTADDERIAAGLGAALVIRGSLNRAVRAGTLDLRQALRLAAESSRLLDPDID